MSKLKEKFSMAYAKAQTLSEEEKKLNSSVQKILFKKSALPIFIMLLISIIGISSKLNSWIILGIEVSLAVFTYLKMKKEAKKLNDFTYYAGNVLSIEDKGNHSLVILKQGKMPVKLKVKYGRDSFSKLKKNQFIKVGYNKESEIASIIK